MRKLTIKVIIEIFMRQKIKDKIISEFPVPNTTHLESLTNI